MTPRAPTRIAAALAAAAATAGATVALAQDSQGPGASAAQAASATASAYRVDDGDGRPAGYVKASGNDSRTGPGTSATTSTAGYKGRASATARDGDVRLFGDLVTAELVQVKASASGSGGTSTSGTVKNLVVAGDSKGTRRRGATYNMGGYGRLTVLDDSGRGITGLKAKLTKPYGTYAAGETVKVAYASASASDGTPPPKPEPKPDKPDKPDKPEPDEPDRPERPDDPGADTPAPGTRRPDRRRAPRTRTLKTDRGFVFPVYGKHRYSNDWGAPRQNTGAHQGNDIFAAAGTPVVSVCNGTLHRVGTNTVPGNRLYLECTTGDEFFYAHLSAFAEDTRNGLKVEAGHVIGFVGSTGDAEPTPPHVHFEVHPGGGDPVNPYPFLQAWENRRDVPAAAWVKQNDPRAGEQPGTLVVVEDFLSS